MEDINKNKKATKLKNGPGVNLKILIRKKNRHNIEQQYIPPANLG